MKDELADEENAPITFGELFSGAGGMSLGLKQAGFKPLWAIDSNKDACETYKNMIGAHVIQSNVELEDFTSLEKVDGLAFGFPCNDFSIVGKQSGINGYFGQLYKQAVRAIEEINPKWFIAENVPGLLSSGNGHIMDLFAAAGDGYNMSVNMYHFDEYGVPQKRNRIIAVGIRRDLDLNFIPPQKTHDDPITASEALNGVEIVNANNELPRHTKKVTEMLSYIPPGENVWCDQVPEEYRLKSNVPMSLIYRRLHPDKPSYTIVASGGGGTHGYHYSEPRALTNRERARLQTFPDDFVFSGGTQSVRKQIGMAVPPLGAKVIGDALFKTLIGQHYNSSRRVI